MRKRCLAMLLALVMCLSAIPLNVSAEPAEPKIVRVLDGKITKGALWTALECSAYAYHYCKIDENGDPVSGWKRLESASDTALAEMIEDQTLYQLESISWWNDTFAGSWTPEGTFRIQSYHQLTMTSEDLNGGSVTVNGVGLQESYEVDAGNSLTLEFSPVEGYVPQVKQGNGMWTTVNDHSYTITPKQSGSYAVRYARTEAELHTVTVNVNDESLGTYTGLEADRVASETEMQLKVIPYNELTNSANDRDAYVKSVKVNGIELEGNYSNTEFSTSFTVTENTTVDIQFAKRLVLKAPTIYEQKYSGDPKTYMYYAKMNMDKKVSEQADVIEASIIESTVDEEQTAGAENVQIQLKGNLQTVGDIYMGIKDNALDAVSGAMRDILAAILGNNTNWGDRTFHNEGENWEEIRLVMPASDDGKYPAVQTDDLTVWVVDIRPVLQIEGTTEKVTVESAENIDLTVKTAVKNRILEINPDATLDKIGEEHISYEYEVPAFENLKAETATNVSVKVNIAKGEYYLDSVGTITVPVSKAGAAAKVSVTTDGRGTASYLTGDQKYTFTLTPCSGYYVKELEITDTPETGEPVSSKADLSKMTSYKDGKYSYNYVLNVQDNHSYTVKAVFTRYEISVTAIADEMAYYNGLYEKEELITAIEEKLSKSHETFPSGTMYLEYKAGENIWLSIGAELPDENCHKFGEMATESLRYRYVFENDQFTITSNEVSLKLTDGRIPTEIKLKKEETLEIAYADYARATDKTAILLNELFDGVYTIADPAEKIADTAVTISPEPDTLEAGQAEISLCYAGNETYMPSSKGAVINIVPQTASVAVKVQPTAVSYGTPYSVEVKTSPENIQTIRFTMGINLKETSLAQQLVPVSLTIQGPDQLCNVLKAYAVSVDTDNLITVVDVAMGIERMYREASELREMGIPKASLEQLYQMVSICAMLLPSMEAVIGDTLPTDVGFYMVGAITAEQGYETAMALDYLTITPKNIKATLAWKNEIGNSVPLEKFHQNGYMDAVVSSVEEGTTAEAEQQLVTMYIGWDEEDGIVVLNPSEMTTDAYTQIAFLEEWTNNVQYASVPITREFALGAAYADVQFVDGQKNPTDIYFYEIGDEISTPVLVDGETVSSGLTITNQELQIFSDSAGSESLNTPYQNGLYWLSAGYKKTNKEGAVTAVGKDSALLMISEVIDGFEPKDTEVPYDGNEKFINIESTAELSGLEYFAVITDPANKKVNVILPESMNELSDILPMLGGFEEVLTLLSEYSAENAQEMALLALLKRVQIDIQNITGWTISLDGAKPSEVGSYGVYLLTSGEGLYLCKRSLKITKIDPSYTAPTANTLTYNGKAQALVTAGSTNDGTMMYSLDGENWSKTIPTKTDQGTYPVKYKVVGDKNHKDTEAKSVNVTIDRLDIADARITLEKDHLTYTGSEQTVVIQSVKLGELEVTYEVTEGQKGTETGTYVLKLTGTGNYSGTAQIEWVIEKLPESIPDRTPDASDVGAAKEPEKAEKLEKTEKAEQTVNDVKNLTKVSSARTGDAANIEMWIIAAFAAGGFSVIAFLNKKKKYKN